MPKNKTGQLPSGKYRYRLYVGTDAQGKKLYKSFTAPTMRKAQQKADEWKATHRVAIPENLTFSEAADSFIANRSKTLSPSTIAEYMRMIKRIQKLYPVFCQKRMTVISTEDVQNIINDLTGRNNENVMRRDGTFTTERRLSTKTVINHYSLIRDILITQQVYLSGIVLPQKQKAVLNIPENAIIKQLLREVENTELEIPILLAAFGPMRRGEICALRMENIDFQTGTVHVRENVVQDESYSLVRKTPKTAAGARSITYPKEVTDKIQKRGYVTNLAPNVLSRRFVRTLDKLGIPHFRFHDLRHFAASFQIALGIPPEYIMERGGWETSATMARYVHALDEQRQKMAAKTNDAFRQLM